MQSQISEEIEGIIQSWSYELPLNLVSTINPDGSIVVNSDDALQIMLEQQHLINNDLQAEKDRAEAINASLTWQLEQEKIKGTKVEYRVEKVSTGYVPLREHEQVRIALAKKLTDSELVNKVTIESNKKLTEINKELSESNKLMSVDLDSIKPALDQCYEANKQLIIKLNNSKEKVANAVKRELESESVFIRGADALKEEMKLLRTQRTRGITTIKNLKEQLDSAELELKKAREIVAVSGSQVLWENPRRGTYLTYLGIKDIDGEQPKAVDGTELDLSKPVFQFHHPSGVSRIVLCGKTDDTKAIFCANTAASMPTEKEKREISELVDSTNFDQVQEYFEKKEAQRKGKAQFVSAAAGKIKRNGTLTKAKALRALKVLETKEINDMSPEEIQTISDAHMLAEDQILNTHEGRVREIKSISSKMPESKRAKNRLKRKKKKS
jgi:hypothetical protein